ncbi:MAG: Fic family protein [Candidatus Marsarchaeota archaeon]|jgi:Fic family protein|nr:Fic family protein [Candidatus Marsarchaeota archaeon]MCL5111758.1 Fic family protein [Candidatus Marsarchaeota archaeon]
MSFIEKQRHGGHFYYYLVKNVRSSPSKVKKIRIFLGREVPDRAKLQRYFMELEKRALLQHAAEWLPKELIEKVDDLGASIAVSRKTADETLPKDFVVRYTYNTNAIEGNKLTLRQTALVISDRIAPAGARADDVVEALNAVDAWDFTKSYRGRLNKAFICEIQYEITKHTACRIQGDYRDSDVRISGSEYIPPGPKAVPRMLEGLFKEFYARKKALHPIELATLLHNKFVAIHPFIDGNGRTARLLMNWVLLKNKFPPAIIEVANKERYYKAIEDADRGIQKTFAVFLAQQLLDQYTVLLPA